jgi:hypothetical protein
VAYAGYVAVLRRRAGHLLLLSLAVPLGVVVSYAVEPAAQDTRYTAPGLYVMQLTAAAIVGATVTYLWRTRMGARRRDLPEAAHEPQPASDTDLHGSPR